MLLTLVFFCFNRYSELPHTAWEKGRVSGAVYHHNQVLSDLGAKAYKMFSSANPLHPEVFPGTRKMEAEVCAMVTNLFHGGPNAGAVMTSGGTESILMSCKTHREWGKDVKGITQPEMYVSFFRLISCSNHLLRSVFRLEFFRFKLFCGSLSNLHFSFE